MLFADINTTDVGVATFSLIRNNNVRIENEYTSIPEPATPVKIPQLKIAHRNYTLVLFGAICYAKMC